MFNTLRNWFQPSVTNRKPVLARPRAALYVEELEDRRLLAYANVTSQLMNVYDAYETYTSSSSNNPNSFGTQSEYSQYLFKGSDVKVTIRAQPGTNMTTLLSQLNALGYSAVITNASPDVRETVGYLPLANVEAVAGLSSAPGMDIDVRPKLFSVGSASDSAEHIISTDLLNNLYGLVGTGLKIGIISDSIDEVGNGILDSEDTGDLPTNPAVTILSDGPVGSTDEGRAMAEVIHDEAPGAQLYFAASGTSDIELAGSVETLVDAGCNIIVDDVAVDDEPWFQDSYTDQAIESAVKNNNVVYLSASGNFGDSGWASAFRPSNDTYPGELQGIQTFQNLVGTWHVFSTQTVGGQTEQNILQTVVIPPETTIDVEFQYDDAVYSALGVNRSVGIYLFNTNLQAIYAQGTNNNIATLLPTQTFTFSNTGIVPLDAYIAIRMQYGYNISYFQYVDLNDNLQIYDGLPGVNPFPNPAPDSGIVTTLGDHSNIPDTITIGAVVQNPFVGSNLDNAEQNVVLDVSDQNANTGTKVDYSSYGRAIRVYDADGNVLATPEVDPGVKLLSVSGVETSMSGFRPFQGTSAAAANAAAAFADVWQYNRSLTNAQITSLIYSTADQLTNPSPYYYGGIENNPLGVDLTGQYNMFSGYGLVDAAGALMALTGGTLTIKGNLTSPVPISLTLQIDNTGFNNFEETFVPYFFDTTVDVIVDGQDVGTIRRNKWLKEIDFITGPGNSSLTINNSNGLVNTTFGIAYDAGAGTNTIETQGDANYTLSGNFLLTSGLGNVSLTNVNNAIINGGNGTDSFSVSNWGGNAYFNGHGSNDVFNVNLSHGTDHIYLTDSGSGSTANLYGAASNQFTDTIQSTGNIGLIGNGTFETVDYDNIKNFHIVGGTGVSSLAVIDDTNQAFGSASNIADGFIFAPSNATSGRLTNGTLGTSIILSNINGTFSLNGAGNNNGDEDTLVFLGVTSTGQPVSSFDETTAPDGSSTINVSDAGVSITNKSLGAMRGISVSNLANLFIEAGNQGPGQGSTINAVPSLKTNIFVDGGLETGGGSDTLNVTTTGTRTIVSNVNNPALGPTGQSRVYQSFNGASVGYQNIQNIGGSSLQDSIYAIAQAPLPGHAATVSVYNAVTNALEFTVTPYPGYDGTIKVATGNITGNGIQDLVTVPGPGAPSNIKVFNGSNGQVIRSYYAFDPAYKGGVNIATGDTTGAGRDDIIVAIAAAGPGPVVEVFSGATNQIIDSFYAYAQGFQGGVSVAAADITGAGHDDIITGAGPGAGPHVEVFDPLNNNLLLRSFFAFAPNFNGGISVAAGDLVSGGDPDIIVAPLTGAGSNVKVFDATTLAVLASFYYNNSFSPNTYAPVANNPPVNLAVVDVTGVPGGQRDLMLSRGLGAIPQVALYTVAAGNNVAPVGDLVVPNSTWGGGVNIAGSSND